MRDLYAISTDATGQSRMFSVDIAASTTAVQSALGPRFTGGLAYRPASRLFWSITHGAAGEPPGLAGLSGEGQPLFRVTLGTAFTGGLAYHPGEDGLFAIKNLPFPDLARIHRVGFDGSDHERFQIGQLQFNGLVYVRGTDRFYTIGTDNTGFSWLYDFNLQGSVRRLFGVGLRAFGGLAYALHEDRFYFAANENGTSHLHRLSLSGQVDRVMTLGAGFDGAGLCVTPWFGGTIRVKAPLSDERFVAQEDVRLDAEVVDASQRPTWDSTGISWQSDRDGRLGTGTITKRLSVGAHAITAEGHGLSRTMKARVFPDLWELYRAAPAQAEIDRVLRDFTVHWVDGAPGDPAQQWSSFPGFPFDQTSTAPSRTAVIAKLDVLRHQRFASALPFSGAGESLYEYVRQRSPVLRVSLASALNQASGGTIHLNRPFASWFSGSSDLLPYVHNLYLLVHENRHNEAGDPLHTSCTGWDGTGNPANGADAVFEPGSGYAAAVLYAMWVYRYSLHDPPDIRAEARSIAVSLRGRFCARPASADPRVQALLVELWNV